MNNYNLLLETTKTKYLTNKDDKENKVILLVEDEAIIVMTESMELLT